MKLLLVEDEDRLIDALSHLLKKNGYAVDCALDGDTGIEMASTGVYDVIILDRMLPNLDGLSLLREFRKLGFDTPVMFLTAKDAAKDRVEGLDAGADDYLVKPFIADELLARLRALTRRKSKQIEDDFLRTGDLVFYPLQCQVIRGDQTIHLTIKEAHLLELLMVNKGRVVTKDQIMAKVWGYNSETEISNVDLYIHYLRKKLDIPYIKTVRGVGYFLQEEKNVPAVAL